MNKEQILERAIMFVVCYTAFVVTALMITVIYVYNKIKKSKQ